MHHNMKTYRCVEVKSHTFLALHQLEVSDNMGGTTAILLNVLKRRVSFTKEDRKLK
jgi:hypothetical protein